MTISPASLTSRAHPSTRDRASKIHSVRPHASYVSCNPRSLLSRCCAPPPPAADCPGVTRTETSKRRRKAWRFEIFSKCTGSESGTNSANDDDDSSLSVLASDPSPFSTVTVGAHYDARGCSAVVVDRYVVFVRVVCPWWRPWSRVVCLSLYGQQSGSRAGRSCTGDVRKRQPRSICARRETRTRLQSVGAARGG